MSVHAPTWPPASARPASERQRPSWAAGSWGPATGQLGGVWTGLPVCMAVTWATSPLGMAAGAWGTHRGRGCWLGEAVPAGGPAHHCPGGAGRLLQATFTVHLPGTELWRGWGRLPSGGPPCTPTGPQLQQPLNVGRRWASLKGQPRTHGAGACGAGGGRAGGRAALALRRLPGQSEQRALQGHGVQRAGVGIHLPATPGHQVALVLGVHPVAEEGSGHGVCPGFLQPHVGRQDPFKVTWEGGKEGGVNEGRCRRRPGTGSVPRPAEAGRPQPRTRSVWTCGQPPRVHHLGHSSHSRGGARPRP